MKFRILFALAAALIGAQSQAAVRTGRVTDLEECSTYNGKCRSIAKPTKRACAINVGAHRIQGSGVSFRARYSVEALAQTGVAIRGLVKVYYPEGTLNGVIDSGFSGSESIGEWIGHTIRTHKGDQAVVDVFYVRQPVPGAGKYLEYKCKLK